MRIGVTCFLTDRDLAPADLARAAEERGFASLYLPEHTHLPVRADTPPALVEGVRADDYKRSLDPFVALASAVAVTTTIRLGTGVVLMARLVMASKRSPNSPIGLLSVTGSDPTASSARARSRTWRT